MRKPNLTIVSEGMAQGTKVLLPDGTPIGGVVSIHIDDIVIGGLVKATIVVNHVALQIKVHGEEWIEVDGKRVKHPPRQP